MSFQPRSFFKVPEIIKSAGRIWLTGAIYLLAFAGYVFYGILWTVRFMQSRIKLIFLIIPLPIICILCIYLLCPYSGSDKTVEMRITSGTSLRSIAGNLEKEKVIRWSAPLILWMRCNGTEKSIQAGIVDFKEHEGVISAARKLLNAHPVEFSVTIPEGLTIEQTASIFHSSLKIDSTEFVNFCHNSDFIKSVKMHVSSLEGYLFPDTYRFSDKPASADIIKRMVNHFEKSYSSLYMNSDSIKPDSRNLNESEMVVLASIVEKEAKLASERPRISAVFHNRLKKGMPLGADPTVRYIFKKFSGPLLVSELKVKSPYNTRLYNGLPPGPICSPGFASLHAAAFPDKSEDLYFVAKWDGSNAHDFSLTYQEHNKKKDAIQQKNEQRILRCKNAKK